MKRMISFMMVLCLVLTMAMPSYAGENDSKGLEEAILAVKKVVEIPDGFTEFYYHSYENDGKTGNGTVWNLSWSDESREGSIYASVDWKGNIISYEKYVRNDEKGLAKINRAQAVQIATNFLAKACPGLATNMREINRDQNSTYSYGHLIQYGYYVNGIPANFINVLLCVDKYTGEIASYEGLYPGFELPDFPSLLDAIDQDTAKTAFLKEIGISLKYHSYYNYRNKSLSVFPTYQIAKKHQVIDAITGKAVDLYYGDDRMRSSNMKEFASDANGMGAEDQNLTKEELAAIKNLEGLLTKEQAAERIKDQASVLRATLEVKGATLRQHYIEKETFIWDISFENAYGSLDAKTGELLCFSYYEAQDKGNSNLSKESAKKIGEAFLNIVAPTKFAQCVFVEEQDEYIIFNGKEEEPSNYSFKYNRKENGIEFVDNGLSVTVNRNTGKVYYYSNEWYNNLEFPSVDTVISKNEMMETMREVGDFQLVYEQVGVDGAVKPVYTFVSSIQNALFDPFNGNRIGWNGKPYKVVTKPLYTDIGGHWSESIVLELLDNGYYLKGDLFKPDQKIKQIDFFRYLFTPEMDYYTDEELYEMLKNRKIIKDGEEKPDKIITRQEIAKYMIRYLGLGLAGEHPEIFSNQFKDKVADEYKGYAALCYGLGIMKGNKKGRFNGTTGMTNAEVAAAIYNLLQVKY